MQPLNMASSPFCRFNRIAPGAHKEDEEDLAWPNVNSEFVFSLSPSPPLPLPLPLSLSPSLSPSPPHPSPPLLPSSPSLPSSPQQCHCQMQEGLYSVKKILTITTRKTGAGQSFMARSTMSSPLPCRYG